jgi:iron complex outermembrane receptor protein
MGIMRDALLLSATAFVALTVPAHAQDTSPATREPVASTDQESEGGLSDIVVTAQRRTQNVQDIPIAITAISGDALTQAGIRDPRDLTLLVPNLSFQAGTAATTTSLFIRGVGIGDFNSNTTGAVGIYVDDVFLGANAGKLFNVFDSDGIEVLKGPQGTLYGRNTTAGAIRFSSRKPTDTWVADGSALYGRFNEVQIEGGAGGPIVDDLIKVRVAGIYTRRDGTTLNRVTGNKVNDLDMWAGRAIIDVTPTDALLIRATLHAGRNRGGARQFQHRGQGVDFAGQPNVSPTGVPLDGFGYADTDGDVYAGDYDIEGKERVDVLGGSINAQWKLGGATITSISAYEQVNRDTLEDTDASPNNVLTARYVDRPRQFSQELRIASDGDRRLSYVLGAFYFHDKLKTDSAFDILRGVRDPSAPLGGFDPVSSIGYLRYPYTQTTNSIAAFGQLDYKLTDRLTATAGVRASRDKIRFDYSTFFDEPDLLVPILDFDRTKSFRDVSYRAALAYQADRTLFYASASKGYNSGGFAGGSSSDPVQLEPFRSERLFAYEVGVKTELLDRRLRINTAAFYYDYKDLQVFIFDTSGVLPIQRKLNAGNAQIYGIETEITAQPTAALNLFVGASLMHSEYKDFTALASTDYAGNTLVSAPSFAVSGGATWTQPIADKGSIRARADGSYQSKIFLTPDNAANYRVNGYGIINARLSWLTADERYEFALWGKNITGTKYISYISPVVTQDQINYNDPGTYGVQIVVHLK